MISKNTLTIIGLIISAVGVLPFSGILGFVPQSAFDIDVKQSFKNSTQQIQVLSINNVGLKQAKNVEINVSSDVPIKIVDHTCVEGNFLYATKTITSYEIKFERMSTGVFCSIQFESSPNGKIFVVATGDDVPGTIWYPGIITQMHIIQSIFASIIIVLGGIGVLARALIKDYVLSLKFVYKKNIQNSQSADRGSTNIQNVRDSTIVINNQPQLINETEEPTLTKIEEKS